MKDPIVTIYHRLLRTTLLGLTAVISVAPRPAAAEYGNSLDWVPADVTVYSTSLRLKEQIDRVADSNAWKKFKEIPSVAMVWQMAEMQINNPNGPAAMFWQMMELPENKQLAKLLGEMFSDEITFYAGADFIKFLELMQVLQGTRAAPALAALHGIDPSTEDPNAYRLRMVLDAIQEDPKLLDIPQMVFAFRVKDQEAAATQIKRLEIMANMLLDQSPVDAKFEREEIGEAEFIVLELDGSMIPWDEDVPAGMSIDQETYDNLKKIIDEKELVVALGPWEDYVLLSLGRSTDHLAELGEGDLLADAEEFEVLQSHLEGDVAGIQYVSEEVMTKQYLAADDLDDWASVFDEAIESSDEISEELKERLSTDLEELADDLKPYLPSAGAVAGCTLLTDSGFESFTYNWAPMPRLDGEQPLEIAEHLGGSPLIAVAARGVQNPEDYDLLAKWTGKAIDYVEEFGLEELDEEQRTHVEKMLEIARPLLKRIDKTIRTHLVPAFEDGQSALVVDADIKSKQWHEEMTESFSELPMVEVAIVLGVSDVEHFEQAMVEFKAIANDVVEAIRNEDPDAIPEDYEIPDPEETETSSGTLYAWDFSDHTGLDEQITLCGAIGENVVAICSSSDLAERVLDRHDLDAAEGLSDAKDPRAVVAGINFAGVVEAVHPWVEYAIRMDSPDGPTAGEDPENDADQVKELLAQVRTGMDILKCFRGAWSETRQEDGVWITHTVSVFEDLEE